MIQPMSHCGQHGLNELTAGIRCNFFSKLVEGAYVHSIAPREPRRLPACFLNVTSAHYIDETHA